MMVMYRERWFPGRYTRLP